MNSSPGVDEGVDANASIEVINMNGQVVECIEPAPKAIWNAHNFPKGMYIIAITGNGNNFYEKIVVN